MKKLVVVLFLLVLAVPTVAEAKGMQDGKPTATTARSSTQGCTPLDPAQALVLAGNIDTQVEGPGTGGSGGTYWGGPLIGSRCYPEEDGTVVLGHDGRGNPVVLVCVCNAQLCLWASL